MAEVGVDTELQDLVERPKNADAWNTMGTTPPHVVECDSDDKRTGSKQRAEDFKEKPRAKQSGLFDFANSELIKQKVRSRKLGSLKPEYNVHDAYHTTGFFQWLAKHPKFENTTLGIIVVNALWISVDTDLNTADTLIDAQPVFITADCLFFGYFSIELIVRFCAFKNKLSCLKDGWFKFDTTLVLLYAFDPFILGLVAGLMGGPGLGLPTSVLRLCRLARLSRLVRMLRSLPELMVMIKGMVTASASVGYTLGLLMLITYVFAIALRNLVPADTITHDRYFPSVLEAMHNLIIFGTFLDALSDFILQIREDSAPCLVLTWIYIALASLTVMNMLIGVLCEVISAVAEEEKESMMVDKVQEKFSSVIKQIDEDDNGSISWEEFKQIPNYDEAMDALESVGVDPECMVDIGEDFFHDDDKQPIAVSFDDFMRMVLDLRGGQQATMKDIMGLGKRFRGKFDRVTERMNTLDEKLDLILAHVKKTS